MGRPPRAVKRIQVALRFEPEELDAIDRARGDTPRTVWIVKAAMSMTGCFGAGLEPVVTVELTTPAAAPLRAPRAAPGSRLKKR